MGIDLHLSLKQWFGFDSFRSGQHQTIAQLLEGYSSLAIFPTGSGKSLCYQLSAIHLPHLTLVVSPLLALMKDQLAFLSKKGIKAASIDSTLTPEQNKQVMADVRSGDTKILMVSVERFKNERFRQFIESVSVSMLVVDEAHCISEWGHNFRPDYLKLPTYRQELNIPLVLLLTATATKKVKHDMAERFNIMRNHVVQTGFYRANLDLAVLPVNEKDKKEQLLHLVQEQSGSGIVYVTLQQSAEQVAEYLKMNNINAAAYHAGFENDRRVEIQNDFMNDKTQVVVATIAFGMGIDKSNIRFVIHYDLPKSIENYSQEIGRAGRDGLASYCVTLANLDGINTVENFVFGDTPEQAGIEYIINNIKQELHFNQWELQITGLSNASNVKQLPLKTLLVQLELLGVIKPLYAYFADFKFKFLQSKETILSNFTLERQIFLSAIFSHTQFKKIWGNLNFDSLFQEYGYDRNRVVSALDYLAEKELIELETKRITEVFNVDVSLLNDPKLATGLYLYYIDKEQKEVKRIATLIRFFELKHCLSRNLGLYFDDAATPEHCGHCSVCRGKVAKLRHSIKPQWPSDSLIVDSLTVLKKHLAAAKNGIKESEITSGIYCRFLTGISVPLFARNKVKKLNGFACCENLRYGEVLQKIKKLGF
ncbi:RecQ family ATP-dependent DNA helicase [Pseudoalteromonas denitrificans]|uniref:DNA 3'-5' helicase n=1 Tax=Pseudoalteromonas denitrificans DSM 6059 TaxID=1123010 RepID=A0A1I1TBR0_9GAMM|nr:RecQ family ATP-dependent DNA helicase [Pseudoalteromonas denitrificans]SFD56005.1 ATP-dependent DNA helicase, RecQ-like [Pseudoalteromonas denitrificans DSM 6059]